MSQLSVAEAYRMTLWRVEEVYALAEARIGRSFSRPTTITFDITGRKSGQAVYATFPAVTRKLRFNLAMLRDNPQYFNSQTVPHEVAHLLVFELGAREHHGPIWHKVMEILGVPPQVKHKIDISPYVQTVPYVCNCNTVHRLSIIRHNRARRGRSRYQCTRCRSTLRPQPVEGGSNG